MPNTRLVVPTFIAAACQPKRTSHLFLQERVYREGGKLVSVAVAGKLGPEWFHSSRNMKRVMVNFPTATCGSVEL